MSAHDEPIDARDEALIAGIAAAQRRYDPVPAGLVDRISFAVSLELMNAEIATIVREPMAAARALDPVATDTCTFTSSSLSLMVVLSRVDGGVRIDGWVTGGGLIVEAHCGDDVLARTSDASGRLEWAFLPHGPVRFLIRPGREGQRPVLTPAIEV